MWITEIQQSIEELLLRMDQRDLTKACLNAVRLEQATTDAKKLQSKVPSGQSNAHAAEL